MSYLFPVAILMMVMSPVLIPAIITGVHVIANSLRNCEPIIPAQRPAVGLAA
jgi:hypothetical protein